MLVMMEVRHDAFSSNDVIPGVFLPTLSPEYGGDQASPHQVEESSVVVCSSLFSKNATRSLNSGLHLFLEIVAVRLQPRRDKLWLPPTRPASLPSACRRVWSCGRFRASLHRWPHESARTTKLYDRRSDKVTLDEVEKIVV